MCGSIKTCVGLYGATGQWGQRLAEPCGIFPPLGSSVSPPSSIGAQLSLRVGGTRKSQEQLSLTPFKSSSCTANTLSLFCSGTHMLIKLSAAEKRL